ncbi:MAG: hypothetical protein V4440_10830 [Pseudomonadota bacterium]
MKEHQSAPEVHKAISEELPLSQRCIQDDKGEMLKQMLNVLQPFMKNVPDPKLATYMVGISMQAIVHQVTNQRPELLNYSSLVEEMVTLIERFLIRD